MTNKKDSNMVQPTESQMDRLKELVQAGAGQRTISEEFGVGRTVARRWQTEAMKSISEVPRTDSFNLQQQAIFEARIRQANIEALHETARLELQKRQLKRFWKAPIEGPVGITVMADIHWGADYVDYETLERDIDLICNTEGLYVLLAGDAIDNSIKHITAIINQGMSPKYQWKWYEDLLARLSSKLIGVIGGNHEAWTRLITGSDPLKQLADLKNVIYDPDQLEFSVGVGNEVYKWLVRHKYRFNSSDNASHSVKKMYDHLKHFEVGAICDKHEYTCEPFAKNGEMKWAIRPGSYQIFSEFGNTRGFRDALPVSPVLVMDSDSHSMHGTVDIPWGVSLIQQKRSEWKKSHTKSASK